MIIRILVFLLVFVGFVALPFSVSGQSKEPAGISFDEIEKRFGLSEPYKHALRGDIESLKKDLDANPELINARDKANIKIIECAILGHQKEVVKFLIEKKQFDLKSTGDQGLTLLHVSAMTNDVEIAKYLIEKGLGVNTIDEVGQTACHIAAGFGSYEFIEFLKKSKADLSIVDKGGWTPLGYAQFVHDAINSDNPATMERSIGQLDNLRPIFHGKNLVQFNIDLQITLKLLSVK